ncbi:MAG: DMT family transporter, partial [Psychromonas sp.]|nr:DMT family transporter [Psychromonas sp.]
MKKITYTMLMMVTCVFFWGSVFPIAKLLLVNMSGLSLAICRFMIAVLCLGLYMQSRRINLPSLTLWQWFIIVVTGTVGIGGFNLAFFSGLLHTSSTNAALIMALSPMLTAVLSALLERRWLGKKQCLSLVIALSGVTLVITNGSMAHLIRLHFNSGDLLIMGAMF